MTTKLWPMFGTCYGLDCALHKHVQIIQIDNENEAYGFAHKNFIAKFPTDKYFGHHMMQGPLIECVIANKA
jgi:hypothetical protein